MREQKYYYKYYPNLQQSPVYLKLIQSTYNRWINDELYSVYGIISNKNYETGKYRGIILLYINQSLGRIRITQGYEDTIYIKKKTKYLRRKSYHQIHPTCNDYNLGMSYQIIQNKKY